MGKEKMTREDGMETIGLDDELAADYLSECREHLATVGRDLLAMENSGAAIDEELVNRVFRAVHSIKGGAGFFDLVKIHELAHRAEDVLALIRSRKVAPDRDQIGVLLRATDTLSELVDNPHTSNQADLSETMAALGRLCAKQRASRPSATNPFGYSSSKTISPAGCCSRPFSPATGFATSPSAAEKPWRRYAKLSSAAGATT